MGKKEKVIIEYFQGKRTLTNTVDDVYDLLAEEIYEEVKKYMDKTLNVEIMLAHPDDDGFEHEGYYDTIDDAIKALEYIKEHIDDYYEDED